MDADSLIGDKVWLALKILLILMAFVLLWYVQTAGQKAIEPAIAPGIIMLRRFGK